MLSGGQWDLPSMPPFLVPARHTHMLFVPTPAERACRACCTWQHATAIYGSAAAADAEALGRERARTASVHSLRRLWALSAASHVDKPL